MGPNGSGKSTLFRIISGQEKADSGNVKMGSTVRLGFVTQSRDSLNDEETVFEAIAEGKVGVNMGSFVMEMRKYVAQVMNVTLSNCDNSDNY